MCDPLTLAATAATAGGALYNNKQQNDFVDETNRQNQIAMQMQREARDQEAQRQLQFERAQAEEVARAIAQADPAQTAERVQEQTQAPENRIRQAAASYNTARPTEGTGAIRNEDIDTASAGAVADSQNRTNTMLEALATLTGQNTQFQGTGDAIQRAGSNIATIGSNRRGSMGANALETRIPAAQVHRPDSILGDLMMLGGSLAGGMAGRAVGQAGGPKPFDISGIFRRPGAPVLAGSGAIY